MKERLTQKGLDQTTMAKANQYSMLCRKMSIQMSDWDMLDVLTAKSCLLYASIDQVATSATTTVD